MRFKATLANAAQLSKVVHHFARLADACLVHLTPQSLTVAIAVHETQALAELAKHELFFDYRIESRAPNNRISFFVKLDNLARALKSCVAQSERTQLKLTKKMGGAPTLTFEILLAASHAQLLHDVPLRIVQADEEMHAYAEPTYNPGQFSLSVVLPYAELRGMRNVIERMKVFAEYIELVVKDDASLHGVDSQSAQLQLQVERDSLVTISTTYTNLGTVQTGGDGGGDGGGDADGMRTASAKVEMKKISRVFSSLISSDVKLHSAIVCVLPMRAVVLKAFLSSSDSVGHSYEVFYFPVQAQ